MAKVIIFGGGDGGGIVITADGIKPIPPWNPMLRRQLRALNNLAATGFHPSGDEPVKDVEKVVQELTDVVLEQVENVVGELDPHDGLVYQDEEGGFVCGSTGKAPIPFPWPIDPRKTVSDLVSRGVIDLDAMRFLRLAAENNLDVLEVVNDPQAAAEKMGVNLTPAMEDALGILDLEQSNIEDPVDKEVLAFYQKTVHDGRYIADWVVNPAAVAGRLRLSISEDALTRIETIRDIGLTNPGGAVASPKAVAVVVVIVIVVWDHEFDLPVIDRSGIEKF